MTASAIDFPRHKVAAAETTIRAVELALDVVRSVLARADERRRSERSGHVYKTIPSALVEEVGYDSAAVWQLDGSMLVPVSIAFGDGASLSVSALDELVANPPLREGCPLEAALAGDADLAATGCLGSGGPMEPVLGSVSYALAAVKSRTDPAFLLQTMCCDRRADQFDLDLVMSVAQLVVSVAVEPEAARLPGQHLRGTGASEQDIASPSAARTAVSIMADRPLHDALATGLTTLTARERDVLGHALTGATYVAIADELIVSVATIQSHMRSILGKLGLHSRAELIARHAARDREG